MRRLLTPVRLCLRVIVWASSLALPLIPQEAAASADLAVSAQGAEVDEKFAFDIPAQPLRTALRTYSESTGQAVLFDDNLTLGRRSTGVSGRFDSAEALGLLLQGTGLVAKYSSDHSFTLKLASLSGDHSQKTGSASNGNASQDAAAVIERYAGKIQKLIQAALCQSQMTRPGTYRLALQVWLGPSGRVQDIRLLSTLDGAGGREASVREALDRLTFEPPPKLLPQPITLLLAQAEPGRSSPCGGAALSAG